MFFIAASRSLMFYAIKEKQFTVQNLSGQCSWNLVSRDCNIQLAFSYKSPKKVISVDSICYVWNIWCYMHDFPISLLFSAEMIKD